MKKSIFIGLLFSQLTMANGPSHLPYREFQALDNELRQVTLVSWYKGNSFVTYDEASKIYRAGISASSVLTNAQKQCALAHEKDVLGADGLAKTTVLMNAVNALRLPLDQADWQHDLALKDVAQAPQDIAAAGLGIDYSLSEFLANSYAELVRARTDFKKFVLEKLSKPCDIAN